jgi:cobalt-zinc-cadmium efflux system outer membrane protein
MDFRHDPFHGHFEEPPLFRMKFPIQNSLSPRGVLRAFACVLLVFSAGCAAPSIVEKTDTASHSETTASPVQISGPVTLPMASAYSLQFHPEMAAFPLQKRVSDARILAAGLPNNPALAIEAEDFGGSREFKGGDSAIFTASIIQLVELGGKRGARRDAATAAAAVVDAEYAIRRREVLGKTAQRFVEALAARAGQDLAVQELALARESEASVKGQLEAGRATEPEVRQARLAVAAAELEVRRSERSAAAAARALGSLWAGAAPGNIVVGGKLPDPPARMPSVGAASAALASHPANQAAAAREAEAAAMLKLARAGRVSDIELSGGLRQDNSSDSQGIVVGATIPLPLFNQQTGPIREAETVLDKTRLEGKVSRAMVRSEFDQAWSELANAHDTAVTTSSELLPGAREIFESTRESYDLGRASFLELLAARRELASANRAWLTAKKDYHLAASRIEALTGRPAF